METIMGFMSKDHDRLDGIFKQYQQTKNKDYDTAKKLFSEFKTGLQRHIVWEEEILFPLFEEQTGMHDSGPTYVMRQEHRMIKDYLEEMHNTLIQGSTKTDSSETGLLEVLGGHNDKEENILYPWIDESVSKADIEKAFAAMKTLPEERYNRCCQEEKKEKECYKDANKKEESCCCGGHDKCCND